MRPLTVEGRDPYGGQAITEARREEAAKKRAADLEKEKQLRQFRAEQRKKASMMAVGVQPTDEEAAKKEKEEKANAEKEAKDDAAGDAGAHEEEDPEGLDPTNPLYILRKEKRQAEEEDENSGKFVLKKSITCQSSIIVLHWTFFSAYTILILRLTRINTIPQQVALILSILTIFVASTEG